MKVEQRYVQDGVAHEPGDRESDEQRHLLGHLEVRLQQDLGQRKPQGRQHEDEPVGTAAEFDAERQRREPVAQERHR
jgi:hypothetical protein